MSGDEGCTAAICSLRCWRSSSKVANLGRVYKLVYEWDEKRYWNCEFEGLEISGSQKLEIYFFRIRMSDIGAPDDFFGNWITSLTKLVQYDGLDKGKHTVTS